jgi:DNA-directed RNA polymerase specialized sigma24 family protein
VPDEVWEPARAVFDEHELSQLETLSPVDRAVFLLRDVFGYEYPC